MSYGGMNEGDGLQSLHHHWPTIYLLLGPSGAGKTLLGSYFKEMGIPDLVSHTTRKSRRGESEGNPYYFVTREQFTDIPMIESTEYAGNLYGTSRAEVERVLSSEGDAFAIVDRHGAEAFKTIYPDTVKVIYVYAPAKILAERMRLRGDDEDAIADRIRFAIKSGEFDNLDIADYCIVNKDLGKTIAQLRAIVGVIP